MLLNLYDGIPFQIYNFFKNFDRYELRSNFKALLERVSFYSKETGWAKNTQAI